MGVASMRMGRPGVLGVGIAGDARMMRFCHMTHEVSMNVTVRVTVVAVDGAAGV